MSFFDTVTEQAGALVEDFSEGIRGAFGIWAEAKAAQLAQNGAQPEVTAQQEPIKGTATDGTPIIATAANSNASGGSGFSVPTSWMLFGGLGVIAVLVLVLIVKKK